MLANFRKRFLIVTLCLALPMHALALVSHLLLAHGHIEACSDLSVQINVEYHDTSHGLDTCLTCGFLSNSELSPLEALGLPVLTSSALLKTSTNLACPSLDQPPTGARSPPLV